MATVMQLESAFITTKSIKTGTGVGAMHFTANIIDIVKEVHNLNSLQMVHGRILPRSLMVLICRLGVQLDSYPDVSLGFEYLLDMETASPYYPHPEGARN
jgi:hypothetical protein